MPRRQRTQERATRVAKRVDFSVIQGNDPTVRWNLYDRVGRSRAPTVLVGAEVELSLRRSPTAEPFSVISDSSERMALAGNAVTVELDRSDLDSPSVHYRLDVIRDDRRVTYAHGRFRREVLA